MVKLEFHTTEKSNLDTFLQCYCNDSNEIFIKIDEVEREFPSQCICLDKETAIKFSKELRKQISFIEEVEDEKSV